MHCKNRNISFVHLFILQNSSKNNARDFGKYIQAVIERAITVVMNASSDAQAQGYI